CSGGPAANGGDDGRASDPWVTFAPNGDVYQISLSASADVTVSAVLVSKSTDGGDTWSEPTTLARNVSAFPEGPGFNDKESITADPTNANNVYAVWDRSRFPSDQAGITPQMNAASIRGDIIFSRTTDGGQSWSAPRDILRLVGRPLQRLHARRRRALEFDRQRPSLVGADQGERVSGRHRGVHARGRRRVRRHGRGHVLRLPEQHARHVHTADRRLRRLLARRRPDLRRRGAVDPDVVRPRP